VGRGLLSSMVTSSDIQVMRRRQHDPEKVGKQLPERIVLESVWSKRR